MPPIRFPPFFQQEKQNIFSFGVKSLSKAKFFAFKLYFSDGIFEGGQNLLQSPLELVKWDTKFYSKCVV